VETSFAFRGLIPIWIRGRDVLAATVRFTRALVSGMNLNKGRLAHRQSCDYGEAELLTANCDAGFTTLRPEEYDAVLWAGAGASREDWIGWSRYIGINQIRTDENRAVRDY
jgi:hypothetical protein